MYIIIEQRWTLWIMKLYKWRAILDTLCHVLNWSNYCIQIRIEDKTTYDFYT